MSRTEQITIHVDPEAARLYREASDEMRTKIEMWLNLNLKEFCTSPHDLSQTIKEVSQRAQQRGLTPEILQSILDEK